mmetsp:Transcript_76030/g.222890  ORF Transcript_76030/g.222890 Transcript_76030/m.222890 type:complete len:439 (+) Transcript_76030:737-2053(+)
MQVERGSGLRSVDLVELLRVLVVDHGVPKHARGVDEAHEVRCHRPDVLLHSFPRAHVAALLGDLDAQLVSHGLHFLPVGHVLIVDLHGARQELDGELLAALLLGLLEQPRAHDEAQGSVAARDADDALLRQLELRPVLVGLRRHLPQHVPALVEDAHGVVAEGLVSEDLGHDVFGVLRPQGPLGVNVLDRALDLLPARVGHAEEGAVADGADPVVLVHLPLVREAVGRDDRKALAAAGVVGDLLQNMEQDHHHIELVLVEFLQLVAVGRVDAKAEDDQVPGMHPDQVLDVLLRVLVGSLRLHVLDADAPRRSLLQDLFAIAIAVRKHQDVLLGRLAVVNRWPPACASERIPDRLQVQAGGSSCGVLDRQVLREPLHRPAHPPSHHSPLLRHHFLVCRSDLRRLFAQHGKGACILVIHGCATHQSRHSLKNEGGRERPA